MAFPQELITSVISEIDDVPTLRSCALASTRTLEPSQRRLFITVVLAARNLRRFRDTPHLPTYTKVLVIKSHRRWTYNDYYGDDDVGKALSQFTDVHTCTLDLNSGSYGWPHVKEPIQSHILSCFQRQPALKEIHILSGTWFPLSAGMEMARTARRVSFTLASLKADNKLPEAQNPDYEVPTPSAIALQDEITSDTLAWLGRSGFLRRTQHLSIILTPSDNSPPSISRFFEYTPSNLQRLSLLIPDLKSFNNIAPAALPLPDLPHLQYLEFTTQPPAHEWVLRTIAALLQHNLSSPPSAGSRIRGSTASRGS
ncbi:hypothetical protein MKEN_00723400 [Mycena kentingensis (nom. inval.)]|nr:hypothetical protein MKEN_00723400 [Mycena kentingensis (nom. inval.)]